MKKGAVKRERRLILHFACGAVRVVGAPQLPGESEAEDGVNSHRKLVIFRPIVKGHTRWTGQTIIPIVAELGADCPISIRPPIQPPSDFIKITGESTTTPRPHTGDVSGTSDAYSVVVAHPFDPHPCRPARVDGVKEVLIDSIPFSIVPVV